MSEYLQRLRNGATQGVGNLQELVTQLKQRYERFYNDPAHHKSRTAIDFVKDNWDAGAAAGAVLAFNADNEVLAYLAATASALGSISSMSRDSLPLNRLLRNLTTGAAVGVYNIGDIKSTLDVNESALFKLVAGGYAFLALIFEGGRRGMFKVSNQQQNSPLENVIENNLPHSDTPST